MRRENKKHIEEVENMLRGIKLPELSDDEIEKYKKDFNKVLLEKFPEITFQREKRSRVLRVKLAYGVAIFIALVSILSFFYIKPYFVKLAAAKIIENKLQYKISPENVIVKDGVGIVIYNYKEIVVNVSSKKIKVSQPIEYEPSNEEKERAIKIVKNSKAARYFVAGKGNAPQDISKNNVMFIKGLIFPNLGKKLIEVGIAYTPASHHPGSQSLLMTAKFTVDVEKGKVQLP